MSKGLRKLKSITKDVHPAHPALFEPVIEATLNQERNKLLIARYVYYITCKPRNFTEILQLLQKDFFISGPRICDIIEEHTHEVKTLREQNHQVPYFQKLWPNFAW
jgi:hypothetical protein